MRVLLLILGAGLSSGDPPPSVAKLLRALESRSLERRDEASIALAALGDSVRPYVRKRLAHPNAEIRSRAAAILSELDSRRILRRLSRHWGRIGKSSLHWIDREAYGRIRFLRGRSKALDDAWPKQGFPAFLILDGVPLEPGRRLLLTVHAEENRRVSAFLPSQGLRRSLRAARFIFWSADPDPDVVVRGLMEALTHRSPLLRKSAAHALRWYFRCDVVEKLARRDSPCARDTLVFLTGYGGTWEKGAFQSWWKSQSQGGRLYRRCTDLAGMLEAEASHRLRPVSMQPE